MNAETRKLIKDHSLSVWLKADIEVLARRVGKKDTRPLLIGKDPVVVLTGLAEQRYPIYAEADVTVETRDTPHNVTVDLVLETLLAHVQGTTQ